MWDDNTFVWGAGNQAVTPTQLSAQRRVAEAMIRQGMDTSPIQHWSQGLNRVAQSIVGNLQSGNADLIEADAKKQAIADAMLALQGGAPAAAPVVAPAPATVVPAPAADTSAPRGIRNNNPLNIEAGTFTAGLPGYAGSDGRFARFETPDQGVAAADRLIGTYANKYGLNTVSGIVGRWAPTSDGNNVNAYAANVSKQLGVDPNAPLNMDDPELRRRLIGAMGQHENGRPIQVASLAPVGTVTTPVAAASPAVQKVAQAITPTTSIAADNGVSPATLKALTNPFTPPALAAALTATIKPRDKWVDERGPDGSFYQRNALTGERKVIEKSDVLPQAAVDQKIAIAQAGKPATTINNTVSPILKGVGDRFNEDMDAGRAALPQVQGIHEARKALDQGAITGIGADPKLFLGKVANLFGLGSDAASNTEVLRSSVGNSVLAKAKALGANPSNADRDYIEKVMGGSIALEESSMRRLLDIQEKWARDAVRRANDQGAKVLAAQPEELKNVAGLLKVDEPVTYEDFLKTNPIQKPQTTIRKFNPATGRIE